jgi:hypothetical protein
MQRGENISIFQKISWKFRECRSAKINRNWIFALLKSEFSILNKNNENEIKNYKTNPR